MASMNDSGRVRRPSQRWGDGDGIPNLDGLPSGKRLHSYGKSPFLMGKLTINGWFRKFRIQNGTPENHGKPGSS